MMSVFIYGELVYSDLEGARTAANTHLQKQLSLSAAHYQWDAHPICSIQATGPIWRGTYFHSGLVFTIDIIEKRVY